MPLEFNAQLRALAEEFFHTDLADVVIHRDHRAEEFGTAAFALGNEIYIAKDPRLTPGEELELIGHELTHVVQQRQGRVRPAFVLGGYPASDDFAMEREATEAGKRFAQGQESTLPRVPASPTYVPVIQRSVVLGAKRLNNIDDLSPGAAIVLDLIESGSRWLTLATENSAVDFKFADESKLLTGVQSILHGKQLMLLPGLGLLVHPATLLTLTQPELKILSEGETEGSAAAGAKTILLRNHWLTRTEFSLVDEFLTANGVAGAAVFQALNLSERIALFDPLIDDQLIKRVPPDMRGQIQREASAFAVVHAHTPKEFADYYQFYIASQANPPSPDPTARSLKATNELDHLESLLFGSIGVRPTVQGVPTPEQVNRIVQNWVSQGNRLGFSRISQAVSQVEQHAALKGASGVVAKQRIDAYFDEAESFILQGGPATKVVLTQDGRDRNYIYQGSSMLARLRLPKNGSLSLVTFSSGNVP